MKRGSEVDQIVLLYTTWPDAETAERVAELAVGQRLAACANLLGGGLSIYRWEGDVQKSTEVVAVFKTTSAQAQALSQLIVERHPYEVPSVLALNVDMARSHSTFLDWIERNSA